MCVCTHIQVQPAEILRIRDVFAHSSNTWVFKDILGVCSDVQDSRKEDMCEMIEPFFKYLGE